MTAIHLRPPHPRNAIHVAIDTHGPGRVLLAALVALLRPRARPPDAGELTAHLRRDIGLRDDAPGLPSQRVDFHFPTGGPYQGFR